MSFWSTPFCRCNPSDRASDDGKSIDAEEPLTLSEDLRLVTLGDEAPSQQKLTSEVIAAVTEAPEIADLDKNSDRSTAASANPGDELPDLAPVAQEEVPTSSTVQAEPEKAQPAKVQAVELKSEAKAEAKAKAKVKAKVKAKAKSQAATSAADAPTATNTATVSAESKPPLDAAAKAKAKLKELEMTGKAPWVKKEGEPKWKTDKTGRRYHRDEFGRKVYDPTQQEEDSDDDDDWYCPADKKKAALDKEIKAMKKKMRQNMTAEQIQEIENPYSQFIVDDAQRQLKINMFKSFYKEQYARLKKSAGPDLKQYDDLKDGPNGGTGFKAEGGHRPLPRPRNIKLPKDFRKPLGRISREDLLKNHGPESERMIISVYGDLFDVSDRPDKYNKDGPYWYMTGRDITWGLLCGDDAEENMDKFYDIFKMNPDQCDRKLQGLMSWWAFYEREYGEPIGRNTGYDKEWGLPAPPHIDPNCSIM